jgi:hypothetical protein
LNNRRLEQHPRHHPLAPALMHDYGADMQDQHQQQPHTREHMHTGIQGDAGRVVVEGGDGEQVKDIDRAIHHQHAGRQHHGEHQVHGLVNQQRQVFLRRSLDGKVQAVGKGTIDPQDKHRNIDSGQRHVEERHPRLDRGGHAEYSHEKTRQ